MHIYAVPSGDVNEKHPFFFETSLPVSPWNILALLVTK